MSSFMQKPPSWHFDSSQWNIPIVLITLECQINKYLCLRLVCECVCVFVGVCSDYCILEEFGTARQQTAYTLRSVNLFTPRTRLYQGICIFWWLELKHFISQIIIGEPRLREKQLMGKGISVVVNSLSQVIFLFLLFWAFLMRVNGVETKEK